MVKNSASGGNGVFTVSNAPSLYLRVDYKEKAGNRIREKNVYFKKSETVFSASSLTEEYCQNCSCLILRFQYKIQNETSMTYAINI
jgi:hypothetical protein